MNERVFVDTNVLIYAHDIDAGAKRRVAAEGLRRLWDERRGVLSTQVLQEFYVNVTRKIRTPLSRAKARAVLRTYALWEIAPIAPQDVLAASELEESASLSFWDALIVAAAQKAGASTLWTEVLNAGQRFGGVLIENPFAAPPKS